MKYLTISIILCLFLAVSCHQYQTQDGTISYTVSMDNPSTHYFHIDLHCSGIGENVIDLKLPAWTPGVSVDDQVISVNQKLATDNILKKIIEQGGEEKIVLTVRRRTGEKQVEFTPEPNTGRSFKMTPAETPDQHQIQILEGWLKDL